MKKQIFITGCRGYLASKLIKYLESKGYKINCIGRDFYNDKNKIEKLIKNSNVVVHLAAITNPFDNNIWNVNVNYTKFLVLMAKKHKKRFIYISTQNVLFGKDNYSKTKKQAEEIVKTLKDFIILRPTIIYGKNEDKYIGKLINIIKKYKITPIIGNGKNKLQPIYIDDLIKIIEYCIIKKIKDIFLIAGPSVITYNELINLIIKKLNVKRIVFNVPISIIMPIAYILQNLLKNPPITTVQLNNIKINKSYDIKNIEKIFKIRLKSLDYGLNILLK